MTTDPRVAVTLSADLLRQLRTEAEALGLPIEWLVASMIVDTVDAVDLPARPVAA
jgi:hypothetical protein